MGTYENEHLGVGVESKMRRAYGRIKITDLTSYARFKSFGIKTGDLTYS